jgi:hypothetical protein
MADKPASPHRAVDHFQSGGWITFGPAGSGTEESAASEHFPNEENGSAKWSQPSIVRPSQLQAGRAQPS